MNIKIKYFILGLLIMNVSTFVYSNGNKNYYLGESDQIRRLNKLFTDELDVLDPERIYENENDVIRLLGIECLPEHFVIKVNLGEDNPYIIYKIGTRDKSGNINGIGFSKQIELHQNDIEKIKKFITEKSLFDLDFFSTADATVRDGGLWIIEIKINGKYHVIKRNPSTKCELFELYDLLLEFMNESNPLL